MKVGCASRSGRSEPQQKEQKGGTTQGAPHRMKPAPPNEQSSGALTAWIETRVDQLIVRRQNRDQREWHNGAEKNRARRQPDVAARPRRPQAHEAAGYREWCLHERRPVVARSELTNRQLCATAKPGRMFDGVHVNRRAGENPRTKRRNNQDPRHESSPSRAKLRTPADVDLFALQQRAFSLDAPLVSGWRSIFA